MIDLGPDRVAVDLLELMAAVKLLQESKRLHEGGRYEAHKVADDALKALQKIIEKATE